MKFSKIQLKPVRNNTVVAEERNGFAAQFLVGHKTHIASPEVRDFIHNMSVAAVIN